MKFISLSSHCPAGQAAGAAQLLEVLRGPSFLLFCWFVILSSSEQLKLLPAVCILASGRGPGGGSWTNVFLPSEQGGSYYAHHFHSPPTDENLPSWPCLAGNVVSARQPGAGRGADFRKGLAVSAFFTTKLFFNHCFQRLFRNS